jgi:hypothetical protein
VAGPGVGLGQPAFDFRYIPVNERQLPSGGWTPRSGVRFPLYSGR